MDCGRRPALCLCRLRVTEDVGPPRLWSGTGVPRTAWWGGWMHVGTATAEHRECRSAAGPGATPASGQACADRASDGSEADIGAPDACRLNNDVCMWEQRWPW